MPSQKLVRKIGELNRNFHKTGKKTGSPLSGFCKSLTSVIYWLEREFQILHLPDLEL